jgi:hypothetical protein
MPTNTFARDRDIAEFSDQLHQLTMGQFHHEGDPDPSWVAERVTCRRRKRDPRQQQWIADETQKDQHLAIQFARSLHR